MMKKKRLSRAPIFVPDLCTIYSDFVNRLTDPLLRRILFREISIPVDAIDPRQDFRQKDKSL
jgi:hypothetical protein